MEKYITVAIPNYNHSFRLEKVIKSVLNQTLPNDKYEIIVVDDGSTDNSLEVLSTFKGNIRIVEQKNKGLSYTRGRLIKEASEKSTHIYFLDADDIMTNGILEAHYNNKINEEKYVSCELQLWENGGKRSNSWDVYKNNEFSIVYTTATSKLWRIEDVRGLDWPAGIKNEDDYAYPLMLKNRKLSFINKDHHLLVLNEEGSLSKRKSKTNANKIVDLALSNWELNERNLSMLIHSVVSEGGWNHLKKESNDRRITLPSFLTSMKYIGFKRSFADFFLKIFIKGSK